MGKAKTNKAIRKAAGHMRQEHTSYEESCKRKDPDICSPIRLSRNNTRKIVKTLKKLKNR